MNRQRSVDQLLLALVLMLVLAFREPGGRPRGRVHQPVRARWVPARRPWRRRRAGARCPVRVARPMPGDARYCRAIVGRPPHARTPRTPDLN